MECSGFEPRAAGLWTLSYPLSYCGPASVKPQFDWLGFSSLVVGIINNKPKKYQQLIYILVWLNQNHSIGYQ